MSSRGGEGWSRREFLGGLTLVGTAGLLGLSSGSVTAEPPPETTRLRLYQVPGICIAPQYVAEELLHLEGFTEVQYVPMGHSSAIYKAFGSGAVDLGMAFVPPEQTAQRLVDKGFTPRYDYARQTMQEIAYAKWREYDPENTVRFYALRLHELGLIKSTPQKIIGEGTDWRFFNELKKALKG